MMMIERVAIRLETAAAAVLLAVVVPADGMIRKAGKIHHYSFGWD